MKHVSFLNKKTMTEIERMHAYTNGEMPKDGETTIIKITNLSNPQSTIDTCMRIVKVLIENKNIDCNSRTWEQLLPSEVVSFIQQLDMEDRANDELLYSIKSVVRCFQDLELKKWEWYSSKTEGDTAIITFLGWFSFRNIWMIHTQKIPYSNISISDRFGENYHQKVYKDVLDYKQFH